MGADAGTAEPTARFSLVAGGPFSALLSRLGLLGEDQLPTWHAALALALFAWLPPALLAIAQSLLDTGYNGWGYFTDQTVYARYLVAVWTMIATERYADGRLTRLAQHFRESGLLAEDDRPAFNAALTAADRRSSSAMAELLLLVVALVSSGLTMTYAVDVVKSGWEGRLVAGADVLSWAGETARFVSGPLFLFLVFRWLWRFAVWTRLLYRISRLPLQLTPLHPDRAAGLGFLAIYPGIFNGFVFALSCVIASSIIADLAVTPHSANTVWLALGIWLAICLLLVIGPLLVFAWPLYEVRERALLEYGRLATQHHLAFHRKWVGGVKDGGELMGSPDPSSASDINAAVGSVLDIRFLPVDALAVFQVVIAAGVPLLAVVATQIPVADIAQWLVGRIL